MSLSQRSAADRFESKFPRLKLLEYDGIRSPAKLLCPVHGEVLVGSYKSALESKWGCPRCAKIGRPKSTQPTGTPKPKPPRQAPDTPAGFTNIPSFNGKYLINDEGVLYSSHTGKFIRGTLNSSSNTVLVVLSDEGKRETFAVHQLMLMVFAPDSYKRLGGGGRISHLDGDPWNNRLTNLILKRSADATREAVSRKVQVVYPDGKVRVFGSVTAAAKAIGIKQPALSYRLKHKDGGRKVWPDGLRVQFLNP